MITPHRIGDLEVDEDIEFQEREWKVQRVGWALMLVVIVLALVGLFGTGPLSAVEREADDGTLVLEYQRFVRHGGRTTFSIAAAGSQAENGEIE
ncbi:MAG TPA: hypothetical protein VGR22_08850, partial [Thermomicrobiales bacterium]|nr:hypothetical protein [Thermomicrobiales bacterium]